MRGAGGPVPAVAVSELLQIAGAVAARGRTGGSKRAGPSQGVVHRFAVRGPGADDPRGRTRGGIRQG